LRLQKLRTTNALRKARSGHMRSARRNTSDVVQNSGGSEIIGARENQERKP